MNKIDWSKTETLVVEDSQTQLIALSRSLDNLGTKVVTATNGKEALEFLKKNKPSIIISDIQMPLMDGYELCSHLKKDPETCGIPVILLTSLSDPMDVIKGIECGADNFLTKPCNEELLFANIIDALENRRIHRDKDPDFLEFSYHGKKHRIKANQTQITDLLLSTYGSAIEKNKELERSNLKLSALHIELQKKNDELTSLIKQKDLFLGMAAHDLRNPLNAIHVYSDLIPMKLNEDTSDKVFRMLSTIHNSSKFMLQIVNDLLDLSVIDTGQMKLSLSKQNLAELGKNNFILNESLAEQKQIKLIFNSDENLPLINCDHNKIEQVLNNLISNAIKFSHKGSEIEILITTGENEVVISVKDQGVGIPEDEMEKVFESYGKTSSKSTGGEPSTGLGLAIVKRIVKEHNGRIWVTSEVGKGSTFYVSLPFDKEEAFVTA